MCSLRAIRQLRAGALNGDHLPDRIAQRFRRVWAGVADRALLPDFSGNWVRMAETMNSVTLMPSVSAPLRTEA